MSAHLDGGRAHGVQLLSPDSVTQMQAITARSRKIDVGLGWFHRRSDHKSNEHYLEHLGGGGGFFNMMRIYPTAGSASPSWATRPVTITSASRVPRSRHLDAGLGR